MLLYNTKIPTIIPISYLFCLCYLAYTFSVTYKLLNSAIKMCENGDRINAISVDVCYRYKNNKTLPIDAPTERLRLHNVTPADTGTYTCVCQSANSQTIEKTICHIYVFGRFIKL